MLKALIKTRLLTAWHTTAAFGGKQKHRRLLRILMPLLLVLAALSISGMFGVIFSEMAPTFHKAGLDWFYFALAGIITFAASVLSSIFMAQPLLFQAKDNDLLLAMPIPPGTILISRMAVLYIVNLVITLLVMLPAGILWAALAGPLSWLNLALICLALPLISLALSSVLGWGLALISSQLRRRTLVTSLLSFLFMIAYIFVLSQMNSLIAQLVSAGPQMAQTARRYLFPAYHLGLAAAEGSPASLLFFLLTALVPFTLVWLLLRRFFIRIVTSNRGSARSVYVEKPLQASSPTLALVKKELGLFFGTSVYLLNSGFSYIFMLILPVALLFKPDILNLLLSDHVIPRESIGVAAIGILCLMASTSLISAPSLSLEGKTLWLAQSLPLRPGQVLLAKVYSHMTIGLPISLLSGLAMGLILRLQPLFLLLSALMPMLITALMAYSGVYINLKFPKLDWSSQMEAVKQSISVLITMVAGFLAVALPAVLYYLLLKDVLALDSFLLLYALLLALLCGLLHQRLAQRSDRDFMALHP